MSVFVARLLGAIGLLSISWVTGMAQSRPELDVVPPTLVLETEGSATEFLLVVRNTSDSKLDNLSLSHFSSIPLNFEPKDISGVSLPSHAEKSWVMHVNGARPDVGQATVVFRMDYVRAGSGEKTPQVLLKVVNVAARELTPIEKLVDFRIDTDLDKLDPTVKPTLYLNILNKSAAPIKVSEILPRVPPNVQLKAGQVPAELVVSPYQSVRITYEVSSDEIVTLKKIPFVFEVKLEVADGGRTVSRTAIASRDVELAASAGSLVFEILGVPFLLLPGCLLLLTCSVLSKAGFLFRPGESYNFILEYKSGEFWIVAVTISGLVAALLWLRTGEWYFVRYGPTKLGVVWVLSIAAGTLTYIAVMIAKHSVHDRVTPSQYDDCTLILTKLRRQKLSLGLETVRSKSEAEGPRAFLVQRVQKPATEFWVCPPMKIIWNNRANDDETKQIREELNKNGRPGELLNLLKKTGVKLDWDSGPVSRPTKVGPDTFEFTDETDVIVGEG